ncbi:hypothetical protein A7U60_g6709 [Sanghuangporus baumii]|uniref:Uncharacterized protein n=1 Tax=Sanghuangporus baumii TaxID=108892 RepID=A0A9Q5HUD9_SANBA|nr:hypothetical protein A7U60_g6709 [Sanghuangporus baumii]
MISTRILICENVEQLASKVDNWGENNYRSPIYEGLPRTNLAGEKLLGDPADRFCIPDIAIHIDGCPVIILEAASSWAPKDLKKRAHDWFLCKSVRVVILIQVEGSGRNYGYKQHDPSVQELPLQAFKDCHIGDGVYRIEGEDRIFVGDLSCVTSTVLFRTSPESYDNGGVENADLTTDEEIARINAVLDPSFRMFRKELKLPDHRSVHHAQHPKDFRPLQAGGHFQEVRYVVQQRTGSCRSDREGFAENGTESSSLDWLISITIGSLEVQPVLSITEH